MKVRQGATLGVAPGHCAPPNAAQAHLGLSSSAPWARLECRVAACVPRHPQIPTDGTLDVMVQRTGEQGAGRTLFVQNNFYYDAFFMKAIRTGAFYLSLRRN